MSESTATSKEALPAPIVGADNACCPWCCADLTSSIPSRYQEHPDDEEYTADGVVCGRCGSLCTVKRLVEIVHSYTSLARLPADSRETPSKLLRAGLGSVGFVIDTLRGSEKTELFWVFEHRSSTLRVALSRNGCYRLYYAGFQDANPCPYTEGADIATLVPETIEALSRQWKSAVDFAKRKEEPQKVIKDAEREQRRLRGLLNAAMSMQEVLSVFAE